MVVAGQTLPGFAELLGVFVSLGEVPDDQAFIPGSGHQDGVLGVLVLGVTVDNGGNDTGVTLKESFEFHA